MIDAIIVRSPRPGDGAQLARAWLDAGRYYAALAPQTFQVPDTDGLAEYMERGWRPSEDPDAALGNVEPPIELDGDARALAKVLKL